MSFMTGEPKIKYQSDRGRLANENETGRKGDDRLDHGFPKSKLLMLGPVLLERW